MEREIAVEFLEMLEVGKKQSHQGLTVFPLTAQKPSLYEYLTLDEALHGGFITIQEKGQGTVSEIEVVNRGEKDVLLIDGEELVGAKQNRILNISLIVAAMATASIPVSCVESGRWAPSFSGFKSEDRMAFSNLRLKKTVSVMKSAVAGQGFRSDQSEVWDGIKERECAMNVCSPTAAMSHIHKTKKADIDKLRKDFKVGEGDVGAVFAVNGKILGADIFDKPAVYQKLFPKVLESYLMEVLAAKKSKETIGDEEAVAFLAEAKGNLGQILVSPGIGNIVRINAKGVVGAALVVKGSVVHTSIFRLEKEVLEDNNPGSPLSRPSLRRQRLQGDIIM